MSTPSTARPTLFLAAGLLLCAAAPAPLSAHDFFLIPSVSRPEAGAAIEIAMHVSDTFPGEPVPWRTKRTRDFFLVDDRGKASLLKSPVRGDPPVAHVRLRSGAAVIALQTEPSRIELSPDDFDSYLEHEGYTAILKARRAGKARPDVERERYTRFVKTLLSGAGAAPGPATRRLGLTIEIVPGRDPADLRPGDSLPVRVFFENEPYAGGRLCATHAGYSREHDAFAWCGRLDDEGMATVTLRAPGWQLLRITRMRRLAPGGDDDWESFWASLTFEVRPR